MSALFKPFERISSRDWAWIVGLIIVVAYTASITRCGPWDPWETHYGEVARNILVRADPMDLWWRAGVGPDGKKELVFASKHALPFWCMAISMGIFRVGLGPADEMVRSPWPELAIRMPSLLAGLLSVLFLAYVVRRLVGKRAGVITAAVVATMPQFAIVTRQAITDIYFIGPVCLALGAWALAWLQPDRELRRRGKGWKEIPWDRAYLAFFVFFVLAALTPLTVLHWHVLDPDTVARVSRFAKRPGIPNVNDLRNIALSLLIYWGLAIAIVVRSIRWRRRSQVWCGILYVAGGLALMGKGLIGPGIIGALILSHLFVSGEWKRLLRCELPIGILIFVVTCFPWHHSMALYRGDRWVGELIFENNLARFASGEQDQAVGAFGFYLRTMGLAALPWVAALGPALWYGLHSFRAKRATSSQSLRQLVTLWFLVSFSLITYSATKYYHYLAPCLPPLGVMIALWVDGLLSPASDENPKMGTVSRVICVVAGWLILGLVGKAAIEEPAWLAHLTTYLYTGMWRKGAPEVDRLLFCIVPFGIGLALWAWRRHRSAVGAMLFSSFLTTVYVIDDYLPAASESWSQRSAIRYYYDHRQNDEPMMSWWFYYRGETFFTKRRIWVSVDADREQLKKFIDKHRGENKDVWIITTAGHAKQADRRFPADVRDSIEVVYENFHYALIRARVP